MTVSWGPLLGRGSRGLPGPQRALSHPGLGEHAGPFRAFVLLLAFALCGYLFLNRGFAYLSIPGTPVYVGEVVLFTGLVQVTRMAPLLRQMAGQSLFLRLLIAFMALGAVRAAWEVETYGVLLAVRDSAVWYYGVFAVLVAAVLLKRPGVLMALLAWYRRVVPWFIVWAPVVVIVSRTFGDQIPRMPGSPIRMLSYKPGDVAVHLALALVFLWLCDDLWRDSGKGRRSRTRHVLTGLALASILIAGSQNRGGLVAAVVAMGIGLLLIPMRRPVLASAAGTLSLLLAFALVTDFRVDVGRREVSLQQVRDNLASLIADGDERDGTTQWRLEFWDQILSDTLTGRNGAFGLGFGINIAQHYEARSSSFDTDRPLRSAHNSHLTILARMGLPGSVLWLLLWGAWITGMVRIIRRARDPSRGDPVRAALASWLLISVVAVLTNAVFDPTLEGPQAAIWLWVLAGAGVALMHPDIRSHAGNGRPAQSVPSRPA